MGRQGGAGGGGAVRRPYMIPVAFMTYGGRGPRLFGTVETPDQRENAVGNAGKGTAVKQLEAGEEKGRDLALTAAMWAPRCVNQIVAAALVADRRHGPLQQQDCVHALRIKGGAEPLQGAILAVEPEHFAVDDEKDVVEQRQRPRDADAGSEQIG